MGERGGITTVKDDIRLDIPYNSTKMAEQPTSSMSDNDAKNEKNASDNQAVVKIKYAETDPDEFCTKTCPADLTLKIEDKSLLVSKSFLAHASPVFDAMLSVEFREKDTQTITLPGKKFNDFVEFMRCMNPRSPKPVTVDNVYDVLPLAHEYEVKHLLTSCETILVKWSENAAHELYSILKIASVYDMKDLTSKCIRSAADRPLGEIEEAGKTHELDTNTINTVKLQMLTNLTTKHKNIFVHITTSEALYRVLGIQSKQQKLVTAFKNGKVFGDFRKMQVSTTFNESIDMCIDGNVYTMAIQKTNMNFCYEGNICLTTEHKSVQIPPIECLCGIYIKNWMDQANDIYQEEVFYSNENSLTLDRDVNYLSDKTAGYINEGMLFDIELFLFIVNK